LNALYNKTQFWDGRAKTLEDQAALPIVNAVEMSQPSLNAAVARIAASGDYRKAFGRVFGRPPNGSDLLRAIASYDANANLVRFSFRPLHRRREERHRDFSETRLGPLHQSWPLQ
jgi:cytochrome c peroxidase